MDLCIGCKGCRRECPTGVDMSRMKIEYLRRYRENHRLTPRERSLAYLPRLARWISHVPSFANTRNHAGALGRVVDRTLGLASDRPLPKWAGKPYVPPKRIAARKGRSPSRPGSRGGRRVALFVDTFTRYFEPENARAAVRVLEAAGYRVEVPHGGRPVCCGRTFLNVGMIEEARAEMDRVVAQYVRYADGNVPIVGLEPSCLLTLRDELLAVRPGPGAEIVARQARLFSELIAEEALERLPLSLPAGQLPRTFVHGHCHEKAFGVADETVRVLRAIPELEVTAITAGCCGMAGSFGYEAEHADLSRKIGELDLAPAVRGTPEGSWIVANGTSCRHQIRDLTGREARHLAVVLDQALRGDAAPSPATEAPR
jgi:Fe-S oxidoreductase